MKTLMEPVARKSEVRNKYNEILEVLGRSKFWRHYIMEVHVKMATRGKVCEIRGKNQIA
jgi:hypothetical protein